MNARPPPPPPLVLRNPPPPPKPDNWAVLMRNAESFSSVRPALLLKIFPPHTELTGCPDSELRCPPFFPFSLPRCLKFFSTQSAWLSQGNSEITSVSISGFFSSLLTRDFLSFLSFVFFSYPPPLTANAASVSKVPSLNRTPPPLFPLLHTYLLVTFLGTAGCGTLYKSVSFKSVPEPPPPRFFRLRLPLPLYGERPRSEDSTLLRTLSTFLWNLKNLPLPSFSYSPRPLGGFFFFVRVLFFIQFSPVRLEEIPFKVIVTELLFGLNRIVNSFFFFSVLSLNPPSPAFNFACTGRHGRYPSPPSPVNWISPGFSFVAYGDSLPAISLPRQHAVFRAAPGLPLRLLS